jgi:hypothetical protein
MKELPELTALIKDEWRHFHKFYLKDGQIMFSLLRSDNVEELFPLCNGPQRIEEMVRAWELSGGLGKEKEGEK